jgi:eukaryotic-like serine/threonine-protein kinase
MTSERWRKIEQIYNDALVMEASLRVDFVAKACGSDQKLRLEIEALLAVDGSAPDALLNQRVMSPLLPQGITGVTEALSVSPGSRFGAYQIEDCLGAGGMGKVFRALDTRLGRRVALKILNTRFADRGDREARAIASLNHPHVCTIFEAGDNYLAMELVDGETLAARLRRGPLRMEEVVRYGAQIADALAAAHARGLIHRDLKPANIMLTKLGVKVLDFGLAKFIDEEEDPLTQSGAVMGTPGYMAPEQREGRRCDQRTDIHALGLILSEMATGKRAEPESSKLQPPGFAHVVDRCTACDPDERWQSARDVKTELEWATTAPDAVRVEKSGSRRRTIFLSVAGALAASTLVAVSLREAITDSKPPRVVRLALSLPKSESSTDPGNLAGPAEISPDGETVVLQAGAGSRRNLWVRRFDSSQFEELLGTEGAKAPFWSPDGTRIAFFADEKLKKIPLHGGAAETVCSIPNAATRGGAWSSKGTILIGMNFSGILQVPDSGGEPTEISALDKQLGENSLRFPQFLPDGDRFIYYSRTNLPANHGIYIDSLSAAGKGRRRKIAVADGPALVGRDPFSKKYFLVFPNEKNVWMQPFNLDSTQVTSEKIAISDDVGPFSLSQTGTLVFRLASASTNTLNWLDREGRVLSSVGQTGDYWDLKLSPDQQKAALLNHRSLDGAFWIEILDLSRNLTTRITDAAARSFGLAWARDSRKLYYASWDPGVRENEPARRVMERVIDQAGDGTVLSVSPGRFVPMEMSQDGNQVLGQHEIGSVTIELGATIALTPLKAFNWREFGHTKRGNVLPQFSPDGRWIAYQSDVSGRFEIYMTDFPEGKSNRQISVAGGEQARWSGDSQELFYLAPDAAIWSAGTLVAVTSGVLKPVRLFAFPVSLGRSYFQYDVARDGQRFLIVNGKPNIESHEIRVIFNWPQLLRDSQRK